MPIVPPYTSSKCQCEQVSMWEIFLTATRAGQFPDMPPLLQPRDLSVQLDILTRSLEVVATLLMCL